MLLNMMKGKLHGATVTESCKEYTGSVAIDADLMKAAGFLPHEQVDIYNITNGERMTTYVIPAAGGSGTIGINGAAAHKASTGDKVIICAYAIMTPEEATNYKPQVVILGKDNRV